MASLASMALLEPSSEADRAMNFEAMIQTGDPGRFPRSSTWHALPQGNDIPERRRYRTPELESQGAVQVEAMMWDHIARSCMLRPVDAVNRHRGAELRRQSWERRRYTRQRSPGRANCVNHGEGVHTHTMLSVHCTAHPATPRCAQLVRTDHTPIPARWLCHPLSVQPIAM